MRPSAFALALLALFAAAKSAAVVSRQSTTATDIGAKPFILVGSTAGADCPRNVSYGLADVPARTGTVPGFGIEASLKFTNIVSDGAVCRGSSDSAALVLLSQDELGRLNRPATAFLNLSAIAWIKVFTAGFDSEARVCGAVRAPAPRFYAFIKEIDSFKPSLSALGLDVPQLVSRSGEKWMVSYIPDRKSACAYIDSTAQSVERARKAGLVFAQPTPVVDPLETPVPPVVVAPVDASPGPQETPLSNPFNETTPPATQDGGGRVCFPADATVTLESGIVKRMDDIQIGDRVQVTAGKFSDVFMFTHALRDVTYRFVSITTASGDTLALTSGHYLYVNDKLAAARTVRAGDMVYDATGRPLRVSEVAVIEKKGLYNPQTVHGDIIVSGVRASTYTTAVQPGAAHAMLAPLRALYEKAGYFTAALHNGADALGPLLPAGGSVLS